MATSTNTDNRLGEAMIEMAQAMKARAKASGVKESKTYSVMGDYWELMTNFLSMCLEEENN
jgi:hypothetical protein